MDFFHDELRQFVGQLRRISEVLFGGFAALAYHFTLIGDPRTLLFKNLVLDPEVDERACVGNAFVVHDIEFTLSERRGDLVFHDLDASTIAHDFAVTFLNLADAANIHPHGGEELEGAATGLRLGATEHDPDFFADLVGKEHHALRFADRGGQAAHRLAHHTGLQADRGIAHLTVEFVLRDEGGHRVDYNDIDRIGTD